MVSAKKRYSLAEQLREEQGIEDTHFHDDFFAEEPVPLEVFIKDAAYMNQPEITLGDKQFDLIRHMEQIYFPSMYPHMVQEFGPEWRPVRFVNELAVQWGKGSGKDMSVQFAVARIAYMWLTLKDPLKYFSLAAHSDIHILNVAMNAQQAKRAFFRPLGQALKMSPWFKDHIKSDITDSSTAIRLDKQLELISGHSLAANFEGLSPIAVILDEISGFQSDEQKAAKGNLQSDRTAEFVYETVRSSAATRFSETYKVAAISFPRYLHDPIQNLCDAGNRDIEKRGLEVSRNYVSGPYATWDVNPRYQTKEVTYLEIPETSVPVPQAFVRDYEKDAADSRGRYECKPERAENRYIRNDSAISAAFPVQPKEWTAPLEIGYYWGVDTDGAKAEDSWELASVPNWQVRYNFSPELRPMEGALYALHVDLALVNDRAGIAMSHVKNWERREHQRGNNILNPDFQTDDRPIVKVDFIAYYEADNQARTDAGTIEPRQIQIRWARNLVRELKRRGFNIGLVTFDSYQSEDSIQILVNQYGIPAEKLSLDRNSDVYGNFRDIMYDGRLEGYKHDILQIELESLNLLPNGKIDHPPGGSKDVADAVAGSVFNAITLGGDEGEAPEVIDVDEDYSFIIENPWNRNDSLWGNVKFETPYSSMGNTWGRY